MGLSALPSARFIALIYIDERTRAYLSTILTRWVDVDVDVSLCTSDADATFDSVSSATLIQGCNVKGCRSSGMSPSSILHVQSRPQRRPHMPYSKSFVTFFSTASVPMPAFSGAFHTACQTSPCLGSFSTHLLTTSLLFSSVPC